MLATPRGDNYWTRRFGRRQALRGAGVSVAGLAAATLLGCGGGDEGSESSDGAAGVGTAGPDGVESPGQVRIGPGSYDVAIPPTAAEQDPLANGRRGGTITTTYLDPPHMDFNRTLSCTVNSTMDYTKNKLTRAKFGPLADPLQIEIEPDLAESWEVNDEATQFTFHLRAGVKFHNVTPTNGRELAAEDVKLSFERYSAGGAQRDVFLEADSYEMPDEHTIVVNLTQPLVDFPRNIAAWSHIDARELIEDLDLLAEHAVGTGPFIQEEWTKKERSVFARNPDYFEEGLPFLDRVITVVQNDAAVRRAAFLTGNFVTFSPRDDIDAQDMFNQVPDAVYLVHHRGQGANSQVFRFQMTNPVVQDERVRRAISTAINREEVVVANGWDSDGFATPSIAWQFVFDERPALADQGPWYQHNVEEASKLMQAAGYSAEAPLAFEETDWYLRNTMPNLVLPMINEVPEIELTRREVDNPTSVVMLNDRNFEAAHGMTFGPPAYSVDQSVYPFYHSKGGLNFGNLEDPEMDRLAEEQRREQDPEAQRELWRQIWDRELDIVYDVFLPENPRPRVMWHNYMINFRPHGIATSGFSCYGDSIARAIWLDDGAPSAGVGPDLPGITVV